jgi:hypothetical protein
MAESNVGSAVVKTCICTSAYQDDKYGKWLRVHSVQGGKNKGKLRCTVCGRSA